MRWSCWRGLVFSYGLFCCGFWLSNSLSLSTFSLFADRDNKSPSRFELKFQSELDNSTIIKRELQQQIFKCQVRLAPVNQLQTQFRSRFKSTVTQLKQDSSLSSITSQTFDTISTTTNSSSSNYKWQQPTNVSLAIDWFRDNQRLDNNLESSLAVINVELKSNTSSLSSPVASARNYNDKITSNNKSSKPRIEIKNTLNGNQLKLTSRLKLNQVRVNDSGHYKCIARASFQSSSYHVQMDENQNLHQSNRALKLPLERLQQQQQQNQLVLIEQTLESNGGSLLVKNTTTLFAGQEEETASPEEEHKELKLAPSIRDSSRKRKLEFLSNSEAPGSDNSLSVRRSQTQSNDTRHATTQRDEVNNNANKGSQTGTGNGNQESSRNRGNSNNNQFDSLDQSSTDLNDKDNTDSEFSLSRETKSKQNLNNQFEDDEDLFKLDPDKIELINNKQISVDDETADSNSLRRTRMGLQQNSRSLDQENSLFEVDSGGGGIGGVGIQIEDQSTREGENIKSLDNLSSSTAMIYEDKNLMTKNTKINTYNLDKPDNGDSRPQNKLNNGGIFTMNDYLGSSFHSTKLQIVKLVHKITPELSCYTGIGEKYRGNVSVSIDRRSCLNWNYVKRNTRGNLSDINNIYIQQAFQTKSTISRSNYNDNHNYCRNPNLDPRGPWCFVQYIDELDIGSWQNLIIVGVKQQQQLTGNLESSANFAQGKFIQRHCPISACSEYLWIYIVAPPLGFLILLSCFVALFIKYIRKSYHKNKSILFRATKRKGLPKFNKLIHSHANRFVPRKFANSSSKRKKGYLDDDIFEIVEDVDWSDAQTHSLSPKSTESLKLNSSFSSSSNVTDSSNNKHFSACKPSISPLFNEKALDSSIIDRKLSSHDLTTSNRSVTQVGPMFATLRCQMRNQAVKKSNKSSTFIEQCNLASTTTTTTNNSGSVNNKLPPYVDRTNWLANSLNQQQQQQQQALSPSCSSSSSSNNNTPTTNSSRPDGYNKRTNEASYLISCSTTSEDIEKSSNSEVVESIYRATSDTNLDEKCVKGSDLPQLSASSIAICLNQQPVYEGKFSQVKMAYMKQHIETPLSPSSSSSSSSLILSSSNNASSIGHLGTQVAVCGLKSAAVIDSNTFKPSNLKLRNLNHLNILKLIGYAQIQDEIGGSNSNHNTQQFNIQFQQPIPCSLIYDMTQLVDLNDWLKQQNKDTLTSDEPGNDLGIRRNLTCFAKQIALAIDYLHDRNIIYKDLACRNCFLDPTKMLVKLASFNIEFVNFNSIDEKTQNLKSMIRPKYLLDYYVIDSRPSDCQLLPLSWIPLESILFNKFNKQTDIWSFGCLLYELFSLGEVAYFGYSSKQVIDSVRSNLMPPQPLLCPNGIYKLMCKCLSDIPTIRPTIKQIYEQLNLYSGQCSSFLDHHLCSLATNMFDDNNNSTFLSSNLNNKQLIDLKVQSKLRSVGGSTTNSIIVTKSYSNLKNFSQATNIDQDLISNYDNRLIHTSLTSDETFGKPEVTKIPLSRSINLGGNRTENNFSNFKNIAKQQYEESNHYDEPIVNVKDLSEK